MVPHVDVAVLPFHPNAPPPHAMEDQLTSHQLGQAPDWCKSVRVLMLVTTIYVEA